MPLAVQQMDLPIGATGLDTGTDERRLPAPKLAVLENARIVRGGKLQKRRGFSPVLTSATTTSLLAHRDDVLAFRSDGEVISLTAATAGASVCKYYTPRTTTFPIALDSKAFVSDTAAFAFAYAAGYWYGISVVNLEGTDRLQIVVMTDDGREVYRATESTLTYTKAFAVATASGYVLLLGQAAGSSQYRFAVVNANAAPTTLTWATTSTATVGGPVAVAADNVNGKFIVSYNNGGLVVARSISTSAVESGPTTLESAPASVNSVYATMACHPVSDAAITAYYMPGTGVRFVRFDSSTLTATAAVTLAGTAAVNGQLVSAGLTGQGFVLSCGITSIASLYARISVAGSVTFGPGGRRAWFLSEGVDDGAGGMLHLIGAPDLVSCAPSLSIATSATDYINSNSIVNLGYKQVINQLNGYAANTSSTVTIPQLYYSAGVVRFVLPTASSLIPTGTGPTSWPQSRGAVFTAYKIDLTDTDRPTPGFPTSWGTLLGSRGTPAIFDGVRTMPLAVAPPFAALGAQTGTGGSITAANGNLFLASVRYSSVSAYGDQFVSPSTAPTQITWASGSVSAGRVGLTGAGLAFPSAVDSNRSQHYILLSTSLVNGTVLYEQPGVADNDGTVSSMVTVYRSVSDADAVLYPPLSTALSPTVVPPWRHAAASSDRVFGLDVSGLKIYPSKLREPGYGPEFAEEIVIDLASLGQEATAIAVLDAALIIFTRDSIYAVSGEGPDNNGNGSWPTPQPVVRGYGTTEPQSVVSTPAGVWFRGATGWRMLGRDLQLAKTGEGSFLGEEADGYLSATVYQATLVRQQGEVRWTLGAAGILVYNYEYNVWSLWLPPGTAKAATVDSSGRMWYLDSASGRIYRESTTNYFDNNGVLDTFVPMRIKTGKISTAGIKGFQRLRRVSVEHDSASAHGMTVKLYIDGETSPSTSRSWTESEITALPAAQKNLQVHVASQKGSYYELEIADTAPAVLGTGEGYHIVGAQVEIGVKLGNAKQLPAGNKR